MTTHIPPVQFSSIQGDLGMTSVFAAEAIREEITERLDVLGLGLMPLVGDLVGSGSDTVKITRFGAVGFAERMTAMATETEVITATGFTTGTNTLSVARHGLAKEETYQGRILTREIGVTLEALVQQVPASFLSTLRYKMCVTGSGISGSVGSAASAWSVDDELDLRVTATETEGFEGTLYSMRHPEQFSDLLASLRNEPALQDPAAFLGLQGLKPGGGGFDFLGVRNFASFDVQNSGGGHVGFAFVPGAIAWVVASSSPVPVENPDQAIFIPDYGIVIERSTVAGQAYARFDANGWFGTGLLASALFPQWRLLSIND